MFESLLHTDRGGFSVSDGRRGVRALTVGAAAVAAVTIGLFVSRERGAEQPESSEVPAGETAPAVQSLEAIRQAGL